MKKDVYLLKNDYGQNDLFIVISKFKIIIHALKLIQNNFECFLKPNTHKTLLNLHIKINLKNHIWGTNEPIKFVHSGGPKVIILATGFEVRGFKPGRGRWIFSEPKNPEYDFLRKGSKAVGPVS